MRPLSNVIIVVVFVVLFDCVFFSSDIRASKNSRYQAPDECKWFTVTAGGDREVSGTSMIADDQEVALVCKVKTVNSDIEKTNLSVIQPQYTVKLKIVCSESIFIESSVPPASFQTLIDLKELSIEFCKVGNLSAGAFKGLRQLRNLTVSTRNNDWTGMSLNVAPNVFSEDLHLLERLDLTFNNIRSLPDSVFCQLHNLHYLNLTRNKLNFGLDRFLLNEQCGFGANLKVLDLSNNSFDSLPSRVFSRLSRLEELYLQHNAVSFLADHSLDNLSSLSVLNLAHNKLVNLPPELFTDSRDIKEIHLQNNSINVLAPGLFVGLLKLLVLDLSENELTEEWVNSAAFIGLTRLLVLNLSFNNLTKLDAYMFRDLYHLRVLNLENNQLQSLTEHAFFGLHELNTLLLSNNKLRRVEHYSFDGIGNCNVLALDNNQIEFVADDAFRNASKLEDLHMNENQLSEIPARTLENTPNLKTLDLGGNRITDIAAFPELSQLVGLRLTENNITIVTKGVFDKLSQLQIINLSNNKIRKIETGTFDGNLRVVAIRIDGNYLTDVSGLFSKLPNLVWLNISENFLEWFDYAFIPTGLQWLDIHSNKITELSNHFEIENQLHLTVFDARNNQLTEITGSSVPDNVQNLYLSNNRISKIQSYAFFKKPNLSRVDLSGNQLRTLTPHSLRISAVPRDRPIPEFFVANNPFQCDCTMHWLQKYTVEPERNKPVLADLDDVKCDLLFNRQNTMVTLKEATAEQFLCRYELECAKRSMCDCCDFEACDCKMVCPGNCTCYLSVSSTANVVSCSRAGYRTNVPDKIPMNVTELYLDGNDFRILGSHSFIGRRSLKILFLNASNVEIVHNRSFHGLRELEVLRLDGNRISALKGNEFDGLEKLRELYLQDNRITSIQPNTFAPLYNLIVLFLHKNFLNKFAAWKLPSASLNSLTLSENAWSCECDFLQQFDDYVRYVKNNLLDIGQLTCYSNNVRHRLGTEQDLYTFCVNSNSSPTQVPLGANNNGSVSSVNNNFIEGALNVNQTERDLWEKSPSSSSSGGDFLSKTYVLPLLIAVSLGLVFILALIVLAVCFYKEEMRVWFYSKFGVRLFYPSSEIELDDREKLFDAFVSYSAKDEVFVAEELAPILENGDPPYKLCLYYREFPIGGYMSDTIMQAVESSRRTIMVLSENLIKSEWSRYEFRSAHHQVLRDRRKKLIIILLDDIPFRDLDPLLRAYLKNNLYLQWNDKLFWQKLKFALPDVPNNQRHHLHHTNSKNNRHRQPHINSHHHHHHQHHQRSLPRNSTNNSHRNNNSANTILAPPAANSSPNGRSSSLAMHI